VKDSRREVRGKAYAVPALKFENQSLTSFSGLVIFQEFFALLRLKVRLARCFAHQTAGKVFGRATLFLQLMVHLLLGYRELRESRYYQDDPLGKRLLGLKRLPDVATVSRMLKEADAKSVANLRQLLRDLLFERLVCLALPRITLDFHGSVQSTMRHAEGTAVGFNKKKKGARSYYPLFCTIAQTGQVLDFLHRSGNVHDSHGAREFILACIQAVREALPGVVIEVRMDSAFFSDEIVMAFDKAGIEFTVSVPFERHVYGYDFKVIVTNKTLSPGHVVAFHEGRGSQEGIFAELKTHCQMGYVPVRKWLGNQTYLLAGIFAHNLLRELQMMTTARNRSHRGEQ